MFPQGTNEKHPKIRLPRYLRELYLRTVGETVNLVIPFRGKPKPQVTWTKNGQPLDPKEVVVRTSDRDSVFFIRKAERKHSGKYEITVRILDELEDKATIDLQVIERPGPPENLKLLDVWGFNVALEWSPPKDTGNADLKGYTVQKAEKKTGQWFTVLEHYNRTSCTVSDLIIGNTYSFRVFSENPCGLSEKAANTKDVAHIKKTAIPSKLQKFHSRDFSEPPQFTQPLTDRTTTRGYSTQLVCCVRGSPKPKVIWMKNQMEIGGDPKYLALMKEGVCSLEIRKPSPFDGGVYTCRAVNPLGEASVDCRLNVKAEMMKCHVLHLIMFPDSRILQSCSVSPSQNEDDVQIQMKCKCFLVKISQDFTKMFLLWSNAFFVFSTLELLDGICGLAVKLLLCVFKTGTFAEGRMCNCLGSTKSTGRVLCDVVAVIRFFLALCPAVQPVLNKCAFRIANKISPVADLLTHHGSAKHSAVEYIDNTQGVNQSINGVNGVLMTFCSRIKNKLPDWLHVV
ncbi:hypothetical protein lerEdw1_021069 [Lerista edwardsae]|nr:hypothetical protein lerEdw1_021070 [Lerista edwardsae]KAJ6651334.1 hypothetical protein lerEdw1_021069 [Lerista edwardsae]